MQNDLNTPLFQWMAPTHQSWQNKIQGPATRSYLPLTSDQPLCSAGGLVPLACSNRDESSYGTVKESVHTNHTIFICTSVFEHQICIY